MNICVPPIPRDRRTNEPLFICLPHKLVWSQGTNNTLLVPRGLIQNNDKDGDGGGDGAEMFILSFKTSVLFPFHKRLSLLYLIGWIHLWTRCQTFRWI